MNERILIICGAGYVSGKEIMTLELGSGLKRLGYNIEFITSKWHDGDFQTRLDKANLPHHTMAIGFISATLTLDAMKMTWEQMRNWPRLAFCYWHHLQKTNPVRVIHTNWHHLILLMPFLSARRDFYWVHELIPKKKQYQHLYKILSCRMAGFVCVSDAVASSLRNIGVADSKILVVHNGVTVPELESQERNSGRADGPCKIGIVGQVGPWKGHDDLLDALALIRSDDAALELHIFGRGAPDYVASLKTKILELGLVDVVNWRGFIEDRSMIYQDLEMCVVPSRFEEPFGLAAVEPGMFCLPVVASRTGGLPEIIEDGLNGLLFTGGNPEELARVLRILVGDPMLRTRMGKAAREIAHNRFSIEVFLEKFRSIIDSPTSVEG